MKRITVLIVFLLTAFSLSAQNVYWVFLTDKAGTTFDPYTYFDAKAIERYQQCGADLYDQSNYPLNAGYVNGVDALATEEVGTSRWMNAIGVVATPEQIAAIERLPYVLRVQPIMANVQLAKVEREPLTAISEMPSEEDTTLTDQLLRMQGQLFREAGIDGKGVRIAVFDGGFPKVNTHAAFKHLRDNGQILKTWNFPNRKENVYGWNSHGTMTLSNIAGRNKDGKDLGLATGAEFLLARTEVEAEPFKEEVWWMQAVEWADKNGANLISSSLGYGKDRYYTKDMDGKSYVAKAGNLAARKGMLVVNSAGNEGDDSKWKFIITPSDADSVLCIGGIEHSLKSYEHISFASFGPTADGRQKPNVCAFAHTWAASPKNNNAYEMVYGTSFSCPLVAGFAACAWQASKGKTAMEMFDLIQRSADLYPYCDYAFGYGVPQASFFVNKVQNEVTTPAFRFESQDNNTCSVIPTHTDSTVHLFYKDVDENGRIVKYGKQTVNVFDTAMSLDFKGGHHLYVAYLKSGDTKAYTADYTSFENPGDPDDDWGVMRSNNKKIEYWTYDELERNPLTDKANEEHWEWDEYLLFGTSFHTSGDELPCNIWSPATRVGVRLQYHFSKAYGIGFGLEYGLAEYHFNGRDTNDLESMLHLAGTVDAARKISQRKVASDQLGAEIFQRVRFVPGGSLFHKGFHWDLGAYITYAWYGYRLKYVQANDDAADSRYLQLNGISPLADQHLLYGVTTRLTYDAFGVYARYRLNGIGKDVPAGQINLPRLEVGLQLLF